MSRTMQFIVATCIAFLVIYSTLLTADETNLTSPIEVKTAGDLIRLRDMYDRTIWSKEVLAQRHENTFVKLWDNLIHRQDKYAALMEFQFDSIRLAFSRQDTALDWDITHRRFVGDARQLSRDEALRMLNDFQRQGYSIVETEWHHSAFEPATESAPAKSIVSIVAHVLHKAQNRRFILRGDLHLKWKRQPAEETPKVPSSIDLTGVHVLFRKGDPAFAQESVEVFPVETTGKRPASIHPVLLHDLDQDGLPELIVGGFNRVYWNRGQFRFDQADLCDFPKQHVRAAVLADFDGDGLDDYLCFPLNDRPYLFKGESGGRFPNPGRPIGFNKRLEKPSSVTVGDIDNDGDLDVFVGQQKSSYSSGFIPDPYFDANDGYPFYLLINNGRGEFRDGTLIAGLGKKNRRHVFSSTFVDLDDDQDLDLLLTNDFCGCDYYQNDGHGRFQDASDQLMPSRHAFGMSHSFGDYNLDGQLDFIMIGMSSTTARRLDQMGLHRDGFGDYEAKRPEMGYGNRLFLNQANRFEQAPFNSTCARTGWSWGSTSFDFDRDGDQDIYIANGQTSGKTTKDYCTRFWCHDVYYRPGERPQSAIRDLFTQLSPLFSGHTISWNGYEHNALLMNMDGQSFTNVGYLMGVAFEFDSRLAVSGDLDGDGRVDLLVEHKDIRNKKRDLYILRNTWHDSHHWIGVHLRADPGSRESPHGAKVVVTLSDGNKLVQHCLTGHSVWAQHGNTIHFGLGQRSVTQLEVRWPGGTITKIEQPRLDTYLNLSAHQSH
ncbi:MAG: CRTAC1 family protein [Gammaproteobacteria bacterium]|nr:CRTAC1 family protein [Gammaproteobacteria bacterium]